MYCNKKIPANQGNVKPTRHIQVQRQRSISLSNNILINGKMKASNKQNYKNHCL